MSAIAASIFARAEGTRESSSTRKLKWAAEAYPAPEECMIPEMPKAASTLLRAASWFDVGHSASIGIVIVSVVIGAT